MKKQSVITVMVTMILTAGLSACGTDNSIAGIAGQLATDIVATAELPQIQTDKAELTQVPVSGAMAAEEPEQDAFVPYTSVDMKEADDSGGVQNSTNANVSSTIPANTHGHHHHHTESSNSGTASEPNTQAPAQQHTHSWVHYDATGHYETQTVKAAWDEPVYEDKIVCGCGQIFNSVHECENHQYDNNCHYSYCSQKIQTGTFHHDAETRQVWVEDCPAYSQCSSCSARQ